METKLPLTVIPVLRREARAVAPNLPLHSVNTIDERVDATLVQERMLATLSSFFGVLAVILASIGLYGMLAYAVVQRTREIGVRMAVGARPGDVLWLVLGEALRLVFLGLILGMPAAWIAGRLSSSLVSDRVSKVKPADPLTIVLATLVLITVAGIAAYLPARRAARMRSEK